MFLTVKGAIQELDLSFLCTENLFLNNLFTSNYQCCCKVVYCKFKIFIYKCRQSSMIGLSYLWAKSYSIGETTTSFIVVHVAFIHLPLLVQHILDFFFCFWRLSSKSQNAIFTDISYYWNIIVVFFGYGSSGKCVLLSQTKSIDQVTS